MPAGDGAFANWCGVNNRCRAVCPGGLAKDEAVGRRRTRGMGLGNRQSADPDAQEPLNHRRIFNQGHQPEAPATARAGQHIEPEGASFVLHLAQHAWPIGDQRTPPRAPARPRPRPTPSLRTCPGPGRETPPADATAHATGDGSALGPAASAARSVSLAEARTRGETAVPRINPSRRCGTRRPEPTRMKRNGTHRRQRPRTAACS